MRILTTIKSRLFAWLIAGYHIGLRLSRALACGIKRLRAPRMTDWLLYTVILGAVIYQVAPQQLPVALYKLSLISMAAIAGYWIDRSAFPCARPRRFLQLPHSPGSPYVPETACAPSQQIPFAASMIRRAIIIGAAMLAASLGI